MVSNLATGEPLWFGGDRKKETLDEFFQTQLSAFQRSAIRAPCVDMWEPFRHSLEQWVPSLANRVQFQPNGNHSFIEELI